MKILEAIIWYLMCRFLRIPFSIHFYGFYEI